MNLKINIKKAISVILINIIVFISILSVSVFILDVANGYYPKVSNEEYLTGETPRMEQDLPFDETKAPIVTIGCSFVYGNDINTEDTLAYKLQQITKRKVYNYGRPAHGIQHVLYKLQYSDFFKQKELNPEYLIYVFITDHLRRMYSDYFIYCDNVKYLRYKKHVGNGKLLEIKNNPLKIYPKDYFIISPFGRAYNHRSYEIGSDDEHFDFLKLHLLEAKKELNKKYKDTKFVIIVFNSEKNTNLTWTNSKKKGLVQFHTDRWKELEDAGFTIIDFDKKEYDFLNEKEYETEDEMHPNGKAWDRLVPEIAEKLKLLPDNR